MWIVPINIPMTGVGYPMQWCYFRKWVDIAGKRSCQVPRVQWWRWSIVGCLSLPWGETVKSIKTNWEPVRGKYQPPPQHWALQLRSPGEIIIKILFSESEAQSLHRLGKATAEIWKAATSAVLQTSFACGEFRRGERKSWQTKAASSKTELSGQQEYFICESDRSVHFETNTATSDCQQWPTWSAESAYRKQEFLSAALGKNENHHQSSPAETL